MSEENNLNDIVKELKNLSKISILVNDDREFKLTKYANTNERKIIWAPIDQKNKSRNIVKQIIQTQRSGKYARAEVE